jgi:hypothetical protein
VTPDEISRRLKAARWLLGSLVDGKAKALTTAELAAHPVLIANRISKNRLEDIEQLRINGGPRRWELEQLEEALGLPGWFGVLDEKRATDEAVARAGELLGPLLLAAGRALHQAREQEPPDTDEPDLPEEGAGGGDG